MVRFYSHIQALLSGSIVATIESQQDLWSGSIVITSLWPGSMVTTSIMVRLYSHNNPYGLVLKSKQAIWSGSIVTASVMVRFYSCNKRYGPVL